MLSFGEIIVVATVTLSYFIEKFTDLKPTANYLDKSEYLPIFTANLFADILIIFITFSGIMYNIKTIVDWYKKYRLSAVIADTFIGILYILLSRYLVYKYDMVNVKNSLFKFTLLAIVVQIVFDLLFYILFSIIPIGQNHMLDFFKKYADEVGYGALLGDTALVVVGVVISAFLKDKSFDYNMVAALLSIYLVPYFIYMKD
jgi:hypothetical protein